MSKNLIPEIAKMLGVELGEEFKIDIRGDDIFQITEAGVWMRKDIDKEEWVEKPFEFVMLCNGDAEIIKLPWKPKEGQTVYSFYSVGFDGVLKVVDFIWVNDIITYQALVKVGWIFPTREEAEAALPAVAKEMGVKYEL